VNKWPIDKLNYPSYTKKLMELGPKNNKWFHLSKQNRIDLPGGMNDIPLNLKERGGALTKFQPGGAKTTKEVLKKILPDANKFDDISIIKGLYKTNVLKDLNLQKDFLKNLSLGYKGINDYKDVVIKDLESAEGYRRLMQQENEYLQNIEFPQKFIDFQAKMNANARIEEIKGLESLNAKAAIAYKNFGLELEPSPLLKINKLYDNAFYSQPAGVSLFDGYDPRYFKDEYGVMSPEDLKAYKKDVEGFDLNKTQLGMRPLPGGKIGLGQDFTNPFNIPVAAHEIRGHGLQRGRVLNIDIEAKKLIKPKKELNKTEKKAYKYFKTGSGQKEPSAFLNELREAMLLKGLIRNRYQYISPDKLKMASLYFKRRPMGVIRSNNKGYVSNTRILDFMDETTKNYSNLAYLLNKLPGVATAVGTGAALYDNQEELDTDRKEWDFKDGGEYKELNLTDPEIEKLKQQGYEIEYM